MTSSNTSLTVRRVLPALVAVVAVLAAACTSNDPTDTTTTTTIVEGTEETTTSTADTSNDSLVFGRGEIPETTPEGFPIPEVAQVGATMIDRVNGVTEIIVVFPAHIDDVIDYFETNLPALGYTVDSSDGTEGRWVVTFSGPAVGEVRVENAGSSVTQGLVKFTGQEG